MKTLKDILYKVRIEEVVGNTINNISNVTSDSRKAGPGVLFVAVKGTQTDGHQFISQIIAQGCKAVVCEELPADIQEGVTYVKVQDSRTSLGLIACNFYDNPSEQLKLVGITGTNGKTTTATLLFDLYRSFGYKVGLISTVKNQISDQVIPSTHTTPDPIRLNELLSAMVEEGCEYCFMEVSSHALDQQRVAGIHFTGAVFSNITHDHLDYHQTFQAYLKAKKMFFDMLPESSFALTNIDDKNGMVMLQNCKARKYTYGMLNIADFKAKVLENSFNGLMLNLDGLEVYTKLIGSFNAYNLLAVYATAILLGKDKLDVLTKLSALESVNGRFQYIKSSNGVIGIIDYAHTPDALEKVLETIQDIRSGNERVITVVGCGGDRDNSKRPVMAQIAAKLSDKVFLTSDNPRSEEPVDILKQMAIGLDPVAKAKSFQITDRREAIRAASQMAMPGDIVLIAGKGHETYQEIKGVKHHFDDKEELNNAFNEIA